METHHSHKCCFAGWTLQSVAVVRQERVEPDRTNGFTYFNDGHGIKKVNPATLKRAATNSAAWWTEAQWVWTVCLRLLPDSVVTAIWTRGPSVPESSTLTTRLLSHQTWNKAWRKSIGVLILTALSTIPPPRNFFLAIHPQWLRIFNWNFTSLYCVHVYAQLLHFIHLSLTLTKLCHMLSTLV